MQEFFQLIANFGFPIVVAGYLLFRFENKIDKLEGTISNLTEQIKANNQSIEDLAKEVERSRR